MNYLSIINKSWEYLKQHRYFWWLGFLAIFSSSGGGISYLNLPLNSFDFPTNTTPINQDQAPILSNIFSKISAAESNFITENSVLFIVLGFLLLILFVSIIYISISANAGLIFAVNSLESRSGNLNFKKSFHAGQRYFWRLFLLNLFLGLMTILILALILLPIFLLFINGSSLASGVAVVFMLAGIIIMVPIFIGISIMKLVSERVIIIENLSVWPAIKKAYQMVKNNFGKTLITFLIESGLSIAISLGTILSALLIAGIFGLIIYFLTLLNTIAAAIVTLIFVLVLLVVLLIIRSGMAAFLSSFWTISYLAIDFFYKKSLSSSSSK